MQSGIRSRWFLLFRFDWRLFVLNIGWFVRQSKTMVHGHYIRCRNEPKPQFGYSFIYDFIGNLPKGLLARYGISRLCHKLSSYRRSRFVADNKCAGWNPRAQRYWLKYANRFNSDTIARFFSTWKWNNNNKQDTKSQRSQRERIPFVPGEKKKTPADSMRRSRISKRDGTWWNNMQL